MKLFELKRDLADKQKEGRSIVDKAIAEKRGLTAEEQTKVDGLRAEVTDLQNKITAFEARDAFESLDPEERSGSAGRLGPELPDLDNAKHPYSLLRAMNLSLEKRDSQQYDGIEGEVHAELRRHRVNAPNGILIPWSLRNTRQARQVTEKRDLTTSTASGNIANVLGTELIQILRNKMVMNLLGARVLTGLSGGTFSLPKQTGKARAYHTPEAVAAAKSNMVIGQVTWTPRTLTGVTALTRKTLLQSSLDVEAMAREDLMAVLGIEFDRVGVNGAGQDNEPLGMLQDPNVPTVAIGANGGPIDWPTVVALETQVATANAEFGNLAYLTSNKGRGKMKVTPKIGSTFPVFLWERGQAYGEGEVNSYRAVSSEQVPSNLTKGSGTNLTALIYGNFQSATYGLWSGLDILVDPYTQGAAGTVNIYMYQDYDLQFRYEQSFAKCVDMQAA